MPEARFRSCRVNVGRGRIKLNGQEHSRRVLGKAQTLASRVVLPLYDGVGTLGSRSMRAGR